MQSPSPSAYVKRYHGLIKGEGYGEGIKRFFGAGIFKLQKDKKPMNDGELITHSVL